MNEDFKQAIVLLLENKWILRNSMTSEYMLIRRYEKKLQAYFREKCGWILITNQRFFKLEKIPGQAQSFMGIGDFKTVEDYVLLCCTMAFLEEQETDGQFLLSSLCEALAEYYPDDEAIDKLNWESYNWRRALIRVINYLLSIDVLRLVEDKSEAFLNGDIDGEALYEVTVLARYFLRSYPKDLHFYKDIKSLYSVDFPAEEGSEAALRQRRNTVYRQLLLSPVYYKGKNTDEFLYLRKVYQRMNEEFMEFFNLDLQLYSDCAMAVTVERNSLYSDIFPACLKGLHDIILTLAAYYRTVEDWQHKKLLSLNELTEIVGVLEKKYGSGWTKELRQMGKDRLAKVLLEELLSWQLANFDDETDLITFLPALFRFSGKYPDDYKPEVKKIDSK